MPIPGEIYAYNAAWLFHPVVCSSRSLKCTHSGGGLFSRSNCNNIPIDGQWWLLIQKHYLFRGWFNRQFECTYTTPTWLLQPDAV